MNPYSLGEYAISPIEKVLQYIFTTEKSITSRVIVKKKYFPQARRFHEKEFDRCAGILHFTFQKSIPYKALICQFTNCIHRNGTAKLVCWNHDQITAAVGPSLHLGTCDTNSTKFLKQFILFQFKRNLPVIGNL